MCTQSDIFNMFIFFLSKLYWTDGNTINMANMDGSNSKILFQNQKDPVGKYHFCCFFFYSTVLYYKQYIEMLCKYTVMYFLKVIRTCIKAWKTLMYFCVSPFKVFLAHSNWVEIYCNALSILLVMWTTGEVEPTCISTL